MSNALTPKELEYIDVIERNPYETTQIVYAYQMSVTPGRVNHIKKNIKKKFTSEELINYIKKSYVQGLKYEKKSLYMLQEFQQFSLSE